MEQVRIIKKYQNRRLYDTAISRYVTLEEVHELVLKSIKFKVIDTRTEKEMTHYVLLQIINERENGKTPIFTDDMLLAMICAYDTPSQHKLCQLLKKSLIAMVSQPNDMERNDLINEFSV